MPFRTIPTAPSSNIAPDGVSYEDDSKTLRVVFLRGGRVYHYFGVDVRTAEGFSRAQSPGAYLNTFIKGVFPFEEE
jgi:hypothetical protein